VEDASHRAPRADGLEPAYRPRAADDRAGGVDLNLKLVCNLASRRPLRPAQQLEDCGGLRSLEELDRLDGRG
jgi:hypothetical protein